MNGSISVHCACQCNQCIAQNQLGSSETRTFMLIICLVDIPFLHMLPDRDSGASRLQTADAGCASVVNAVRQDV